MTSTPMCKHAIAEEGGHDGTVVALRDMVVHPQYGGTRGLGPVKTSPDQDHAAFEEQHGYTATTEFVAGRKDLGRDACQGDSGGPVYLRTGASIRLAGLTSRATRGHNRPCGDGGIYVRPLKYTTWIEQVAGDHGIVLSLAGDGG